MAVDPRFSIKDIIDGVTTTIDDGVTAATIIYMYEGGPETINSLFFGTTDADVVVTVGEARRTASPADRRSQDVPQRYTGDHKVTVTTVDKTGVTGTLVQFKMKVGLQTAIEAAAQQAGYTVTIESDQPRSRRAWGTSSVWVIEYSVQFKPLEGSP